MAKNVKSRGGVQTGKANQGRRQRNPKQDALSNLYGAGNVNAATQWVNQFLPATNPDGSPAHGSVSTQLQGGNDVLDRYKAGLEGYTAPQYQASREQMMRGLNSNTQTTLSQLAKGQARGKVYGAAATAQQGNVMRAAQQNKDNLEQDLMVKNIDEQQKRLGEYAGEAGKQREEVFTREKFNIDEANKYKNAQMAGFLGIAGLGLSKAQQAAMQKLYEKGIGSI